MTVSGSSPDPDSTAELLRRALAAEASDVQPSPDALDSIRQRTSTSTAESHRGRLFGSGSAGTGFGLSRPSWVVGALGAGLATAAVITTVAVVGDRNADTGRTPQGAAGQTTLDSPITPTTSPPPSQQPTSSTDSPSSDPTASTNLPSPSPRPLSIIQPVYFFATSGLDAIPGGQPNPRLYGEPHTVVPNSDTSVAEAAVHEFLTSRPIDADYSSGWPSGVDVIDVTQTGDVTTIDLTGNADIQNSPAPHPPSPFRLLAIQALLATAGVEHRAAFTYNGEPVDYLFHEPALVARQPDDEVRALVSITSPVDGQLVADPVTVTGSANVFEANVNWELLDTSGKVIDSGSAMAGFTEWRDFSIDLGTLVPGSYTVRAFESSPEDGRPTLVDDKTFTVR